MPRVFHYEQEFPVYFHQMLSSEAGNDNKHDPEKNISKDITEVKVIHFHCARTLIRKLPENSSEIEMLQL